MNVVENSLYLTMSEGIWYLFNFIIFLIISRIFGAEKFGEFSFSLAIASIVAMIVDFGINHVLIRDFTKEKNREESLFANAIVLRIIIVVTVSIIVLFFLILLEEDLSLKYLIILLVAQSVFYVVNTTFFAVYRSLGSFKYETFLKAVNRIITLSLVLVSIYFSSDMLGIGFAFLIGTIVTLLATVLFNKSKFRRPNVEGIKAVFRESWPFGILIVLTAIYYKNSTIMLSYLSNNYIVGNYNVAFNLLLLFLLVPGILSYSAYPVIAKLKKKEEIFLRIRKYRKIMFLYSLVCILGSFLIGPWFIKIIYGLDFDIAAKILMLLSLSTVFLFQNIFSTLLLATLKKQQIVFIIALAVTVMNIILNGILITYTSVYGAALAFLITEFIGYIIYTIYLRRKQFCHS